MTRRQLRWFGDADARDAIDAVDYGPQVSGASTGRYLTDLADVLRAAGLPVHEYGDWQHRARSSGGYASGEPHVVIVHHTASVADPDDDAYYIAEGSDIAPIANLLLDRTGVWWVLAAGACNHAGSGGPRGDVPVDSCNTRSIGVEAANAGTGEPWPKVQTDSYVAGVAALIRHYGIHVGDCWGHVEWTDRKIDPAGPSPWAAGAATWDLDAFRGSVALYAPPSSPPPPPWPTAANTLTAADIEWIQNAVYAVLELWHGAHP